VRIDPDTCRDADLLAAEVRRLQGVIAASEPEIAELEQAIRRLAEQDATLSVCNGNVTVTMDATLTDAERDAIKRLGPCGDPMASRIVTLTPEERAVFHDLLRRLG
jgi:hypothetical protein